MDYSQVITRSHTGMSVKLSNAKLINKEFGPFVIGNDHVSLIGTNGPSTFISRSKVDFISFSNLLAWFCGLLQGSYSLKELLDSYVCHAGYLPGQVGLQEFSLDYSQGRYSDQKLLVLLEKTKFDILRLKLPSEVEFPVREDLYEAKVVKGTHPGILTRAVFKKALPKGAKKIDKEHVVLTTVMQLMSVWDKIGHGGIEADGSYYCYGSREKIGESSPGEGIKTRALFIPETHDVLLGSTFYEKFKTSWVRSGLYESEIWLGHSDTHCGFQRRYSNILKHNYHSEIDGKQHDAHVEKPIELLAFDIFWDCWAEHKNSSGFKKYFLNSFVNKKYVSNSGGIFSVRKGIPTGHAFTSLINSLSTWIIWTVVIENCPCFSEVKLGYSLQIQGDDVVISSDLRLRENCEKEIEDWILVNLNYRVSLPDNLNATIDSEKQASFLKRFLDGNLLSTRLRDVYDKLLYGPETIKSKHNRYFYLRRRIRDLVVSNQSNVSELGRYYAFFKLFGDKERDLEFIYKSLILLLFKNRNEPMKNLETVLDCFSVSKKEFDLLCKEESDRINAFYTVDYLVLKFERDYKDYWDKRKVSVPVWKIIRSNDFWHYTTNYNHVWRILNS